MSLLTFIFITVRYGCNLNTLRLRQNGRHFADDIFKCIFLNENVWKPIKISLKFVPESPINNILALAQIMARHRPGHKPLSELMMVSLLTHICITRPQWVKSVIFISKIDILSISCEIALRWMHETSLIVNIGSGNGLVLPSNKPLPEPVLTQLFGTLWRHQATMSW